LAAQPRKLKRRFLRSHDLGINHQTPPLSHCYNYFCLVLGKSSKLTGKKSKNQP